MLKVTLLHGRFSRFSNLTNGTKPPRTSHIYLELTGNISDTSESIRKLLFKSEYGNDSNDLEKDNINNADDNLSGKSNISFDRGQTKFLFYAILLHADVVIW